MIDLLASVLSMWVVWCGILPHCIAHIAVALTEDEIFEGLRAYLEVSLEPMDRPWKRRLFYLINCRRCLSNWISLGFSLLIIDIYWLVAGFDWRVAPAILLFLPASRISEKL